MALLEACLNQVVGKRNVEVVVVGDVLRSRDNFFENF